MAKAVRSSHTADAAASRAIALRYVDDDRRARRRAIPPIRTDPSDAIAGLTPSDGRVTILMPHPERTLRVANYSWAPREWAGWDIRRGCACSATRGPGWAEAVAPNQSMPIKKGLAPRGPGLIFVDGAVI